MKSFGSSALLWSGALLHLVFANPARAQVNITEWTGGSGTVFANSWTNGRPGEFSGPSNEHLSLTQFTGPTYGHTLVRINSGEVTFSPAVTTAYNVTGVPDDRYSTTAFVNYLGLPDTVIGNTGTASLLMKNGFRLVTSDVTLGATSTGAGVLDIDGPPATGAPTIYPENFNSIDTVTVGDGGIGRLNLKNGATFDYCDYYYRFSLAGGEVRWNKWQLLAGNQSGSNGFITVSGPGSRMKYEIEHFGGLEDGAAGGTMLGLGGTGGLTLEAGGSMLSRAGRLGVLAGGSGFASVTGAGSRWDIDAQLWVGERSAGSMLISNGGLVRSGFGPFYKGTVVDPVNPDTIADDYGSIGKYAGSNGSVVVNGSDSRWEHNANLIVGESGTGSLTLEGGTVVSAYRASGPTFDYADVTNATIGLNGGSTGSVKISSGHWQNGSGLTIGDQGNGTLTIGGGTVDVAADPIKLGVAGSGTLVFGGDAGSSGVGSLGGSIIEGGAGATVVEFKHNSSAFTMNKVLKNIKTIKNTGPGKTTISGQIQTVSNIRAELGTLELSDTQHPIDAKTITITGGQLILNGASLTLPGALTANGTLSKGGISLINGGKLNSAINLSGNSGTASFTVDGSGSIFTPVKVSLLPSLIIGDSGAGNLTATNFGKIQIDPATGPPVILGNNTGGIGTLSILSLGSEMTTGSLTVGKLGVGNVVLNYGPLSSTNAVLGAQAGSSGSVTISNLGSWRIAANSLSAGSSGTGRVTLNSSGSLRIGPTGAGNLILGETETGKGTLEIGTGGNPGILYASNVLVGDSELGAEVLFRHGATSYNFAPNISRAVIRVLDGNLGTTTLTGHNTDIPNAIVTSGGLRVAQGGSLVIVNEAIIGDERPQDMNGGALAFLEIDGTGSILAADRDIIVGSKADAQLRLKNGGVAQSGRPEELHEIILGDQHGIGTVIFGGTGAAPGNVSASAIRSVEAGGKVIFDHPATDLVVSAGFSGNLAVEHRGTGITRLTGNLANTGATAITAGTLLYTSSSNSSLVTVSGNGSVGGTGLLPKLTLQSGGAISPGDNGIGSQRVGIFNVAAGAKFRIDLGPNLTCDQILNNSAIGVYIDTAFNPPATGNVTFEFRNAGMNQNGVYPIFRPYTQLTPDFLSRLNFTANFPLQGYFQQTYFNGGIGNRYYQVEFVTTNFGASDYDTWATGYSLDPATTGLPTSDPDKDGLNNMLEFILGSSPVSGQMTRLPQMTVAGNNASFTFLRRSSSATLFHTTVQSSSDLAAWTDLPAASLASAASGVTGYDAITASIPIPANSPKFFARLKVEPVSP